MIIKIIKNGSSFSSGINSLADVKVSMTQSLYDLIGKESEIYPVSLEKSFLDGNVIDGVKWRDLLDNETPDPNDYGLLLKDVVFSVKEVASNVFSLFTNGKEVLQFDLNVCPPPTIDKEKYNHFIGNSYGIDYIIGGEFTHCTMRMRDFLEYIADKILGNEWKKKYNEIIKKYRESHTDANGKVTPGWVYGVCNSWDRDRNVEFSNFRIFSEVKSQEINEFAKNTNASRFVVAQCINIVPYRNQMAHNVSSLVGQGSEILGTIITTMEAIAKILGNKELGDLLQSKKGIIQELFTEREEMLNHL